MNSNELISEINQLALSEKLLLVEELWDSIAKSNGTIPFPEWQKSELNKRYDEYKNGNLKLHDWESVHKELRARQQ